MRRDLTLNGLTELDVQHIICTLDAYVHEKNVYNKAFEKNHGYRDEDLDDLARQKRRVANKLASQFEEQGVKVLRMYSDCRCGCNK